MTKLVTILHATYGTIFLFKGSTIRLCSASFSSTKSMAWLVRSSMDSFIKVVAQKKLEKVYTIHTKKIELIRKYIREGKNVFICGAIGVGKSFILKEVLEGLNSVELLPEHMKTKCLFLPFIRPSTKHVYIDDYDPVFKPIVEKVSDGDRISRGSLLITTTNMCMYPNFETVFIPKHNPRLSSHSWTKSPLKLKQPQSAVTGISETSSHIPMGMTRRTISKHRRNSSRMFYVTRTPFKFTTVYLNMVTCGTSSKKITSTPKVLMWRGLPNPSLTQTFTILTSTHMELGVSCRILSCTHWQYPNTLSVSPWIGKRFDPGVVGQSWETTRWGSKSLRI